METYLLTYANSSVFCLFLFCFVMYVWRFRIALVRALVGNLVSQYGVVCAMLMCGVVVGLSRVLPSLASWSDVLLLVILVCASTF